MSETSRTPVDPARWARVVRRLVLPIMVLCVVALWLSFGWATIPQGMDTLPGAQQGEQRMPSVPPGSQCLIDKWTSSVRVGSAVLFEHEDRVLLSRVVAVREDGMVVRHDNERSAIPDSDDIGTIPWKAHVGTILSVFPPEERGQ